MYRRVLSVLLLLTVGLCHASTAIYNDISVKKDVPYGFAMAMLRLQDNHNALLLAGRYLVFDEEVRLSQGKIRVYKDPKGNWQEVALPGKCFKKIRNRWALHIDGNVVDGRVQNIHCSMQSFDE